MSLSLLPRASASSAASPATCTGTTDRPSQDVLKSFHVDTYVWVSPIIDAESGKVPDNTEAKAMAACCSQSPKSNLTATDCWMWCTGFRGSSKQRACMKKAASSMWGLEATSSDASQTSTGAGAGSPRPPRVVSKGALAVVGTLGGLAAAVGLLM